MDHLSILKNFLDGENRLKAFPSKRKLQLCAVRYLAEKFEPGRIYTEGEVNGLLNQWHTFRDPETCAGSSSRTTISTAGGTAAPTGWRPPQIRNKNVNITRRISA